MLSFSTNGSGKGRDRRLAQRHRECAKEMAPELAIDGEMQFDAAVSPPSASSSSPLQGRGLCQLTFIFPPIRPATSATRLRRRRIAAYGYPAGPERPINDLSAAATPTRSTRWPSSPPPCPRHVIHSCVAALRPPLKLPPAALSLFTLKQGFLDSLFRIGGGNVWSMSSIVVQAPASLAREAGEAEMPVGCVMF